MKTKRTNQSKAKGTGAGSIAYQIKAAALVRAGLVTAAEVHLTPADMARIERLRLKWLIGAQATASGATYAARAWSSGGAWAPVAIVRGARGGFDCAPVVVPWDRSRHDRAAVGYASALRTGRHLRLWARALAAFPYLGDGSEIPARRGGWLDSAMAARAERIAAAAEDLRAASARRMAGDPVKLGTDEARARRARAAARGQSAAGACLQYFARTVQPVRAPGARLSCSAASAAGLAVCLVVGPVSFATDPACQAASSFRRTWALRKDSESGEVSAVPVDPASLQGRRLRGCLGVPLRVVRAAGVRVNRHHRRRQAIMSASLKQYGGAALDSVQRLAGHAAAIARKFLRGDNGKSAACRDEIGAGAASDDVAAYYVRLTPELVGIARHAGLAFAARVQAGYSRINRRGRRAIEGAADMWAEWQAANGQWRKFRGLSSVVLGMLRQHEYGATRARDGREVPGGWALQGAIAGLADFSLVPVGEGAEVSRDDMGAAEWSAMVDAAAARLGMDSLIAEGYSPGIAGVLAAGDPLPDPEDTRAAGVIIHAPDSGAGSGRPGSVLQAIAGAVSAAREKTSKAAGSTPQAAAAARRAAMADRDLLDAVRAWAEDGQRMPVDMVRRFFECDASGALVLNADGQPKISNAGDCAIRNLRAKYGIAALERIPARATVAATSPARAHELRQAGACDAIRRPVRVAVGSSGDEAASAGALATDGGGARLVPGLIQSGSCSEAERLRIALQSMAAS